MPLPTDSNTTKKHNIYMQLWGKKQPQHLTVENQNHQTFNATGKGNRSLPGTDVYPTCMAGRRRSGFYSFHLDAGTGNRV